MWAWAEAQKVGDEIKKEIRKKKLNRIFHQWAGLGLGAKMTGPSLSFFYFFYFLVMNQKQAAQKGSPRSLAHKKRSKNDGTCS